jgi:hypothetical protein
MTNVHFITSRVVTFEHVYFSGTVADLRKLRLQEWKEKKRQQKMLKEASQKPVFKCGIVHHKIWSPCNNNSSNINHIKHNKKASSTLAARPEQPRLRQKAAVMKNTSFAPSNFKFKVVSSILKMVQRGISISF